MRDSPATPVDRGRDVEPDRPEIGVDPPADPNAEAHRRSKVGYCGLIDLAGVDEGDQAIIAEAVAALESELGEASARPAAPTMVGGVLPGFCGSKFGLG